MRKFNKVQAKKKLMKSNKSISRTFFCQISFFLQFQKWPKINFWTGKKFKNCQKWNFMKIFFDLFDFTSFLPGLFFNFLARCVPMGVAWTSLRAWPTSSSSVLNSIGDGASIRFLSSWILFPLVIRSMTEDTCFFILEVSLATSNVIGVAPWFSFPTLAKEVRSKNVNAASVVSSQP